MFTLWRKVELAETAYFRPLANYSSSINLNDSRHLDVLKKESVNTQSNELEMEFKTAISPLQVLNKLPSNPSEIRQLPGETVYRALRTISILQRANQDNLKPDFITSHPKFEQLCRRLKRCSTVFTPDEVIQSFKFLCSLGVPTNSEISLILLNLIRHEINNLSIERIIDLDYALERNECRSELQKSIAKSLPIVFELQLSQQVDIGTPVSNLIKILCFYAKHRGLDAENENLMMICKLLYAKSEEISATEAMQIIYPLCTIDRFHLPKTIKLITLCIRKLVEQISEIDVNDMQKVIQRLIVNSVNRFSPFQFNVHCLLKGFAERISQNDLGLDKAITLQNTLKNISFQSTTLLTYIGDKLIANVDDIQTMSSNDIFTIVQAFANSGFLPHALASDEKSIWSERILPAILSNVHLAQFQPSSFTWLRFTLQLAVLGHFNQELISRVFSPAYLDGYLNRDKLSILDLYKVLILYQTVAMQPNIDEINQASDLKPKMAEVCKKYMEQLPSCDVQLDLIDHFGRSCVLTNVRTKYMHLLPTLVKINKANGQFEPFPNDITRSANGFIPLEAVPCGINEVLICVDSIKRHHLFSNVSSRKTLIGVREIADEMKIGAFRLRSKQLESMGLAVCEINYRRYKNVQMDRKYQYLLERITNCACKNDDALTQQ